MKRRNVGSVVKLSESKLKSLDEELFLYNQIPSIIANEKIKIQTECELDENVGGSRSSKIRKPTEELTIRYSENTVINRHERMRKEVDRAYRRMTDEQKMIFDIRWIIYDSNTWEEIASKMYVSTKTIYRKREKILELYAMEKGEFFY